MSKRKAAAAAAGPIKESSQTTKVEETDVSLSAWKRRQESIVANSVIIWPLSDRAPDRECLFAPVLEILEFVRSPSGEIRTVPFLVACRHTAPITIQFGDSLNCVRTCIFSCAVENLRYFCLAHKIHGFFGRAVSELTGASSRLVYDAKTLMKWHEEKILRSKYAPEKDFLLKVIGGNGDVMGDMEKFCTSFTPLLKQNHEFLASLGMDDELMLSGASPAAKVTSTYPKKRKMGKTMFAPALEELESVKSESKEILTKHFLESCNKIMPVIDAYLEVLCFLLGMASVIV